MESRLLNVLVGGTQSAVTMRSSTGMTARTPRPDRTHPSMSVLYALLSASSPAPSSRAMVRRPASTVVMFCATNQSMTSTKVTLLGWMLACSISSNAPPISSSHPSPLCRPALTMAVTSALNVTMLGARLSLSIIPITCVPCERAAPASGMSPAAAARATMVISELNVTTLASTPDVCIFLSTCMAVVKAAPSRSPAARAHALTRELNVTISGVSPAACMSSSTASAFSSPPAPPRAHVSTRALNETMSGRTSVARMVAMSSVATRMALGFSGDELLAHVWRRVLNVMIVGCRPASMSMLSRRNPRSTPNSSPADAALAHVSRSTL
mmetsp:Transcript_19820/g.48670  ORF Transcript_19820/g.48670 Transcript_19820/m.48670 type:complete len:326 (-) Transcript_19820:973-1950(-)